jgi:hypothetical protein
MEEIVRDRLAPTPGKLVVRPLRATGKGILAATISVTALVVGGCGGTGHTGAVVGGPGVAGSHPLVFQTPGSFYRPPQPLPRGHPGELIRSQPLAAPAGFHAWRILYHSRSLTGADIPVSGLVVVADRSAPPGGRPVLAYAHGVTGLARACAPSNATEPFQGLQRFAQLLQGGSALVATDYPGLGAPGPSPFLVGDSEARAVLDAIRAARYLPGLHVSSNIVVFGDTQGGQAALFTGQIASSYAPELHLLGVEAQAPPVDVLADERHAASTSFAVEFLLEAAAGYSAAHPSAQLGTILTARGIAELALLHSECDDQFGRATAGQAVRAVFSKNPLTTRPWSRGLAADLAGTTRTAAPILIVQGTGDPRYPASITAKFVQRACQLGDTIDYRTYPQIGHASTAAAAPAVIAWISDRLASRSPANSCR